MIPTLLLKTSAPTTTVQVPQQSYVLTARGSLGRPQELERKREGGLWQHQRGRRWRLRGKKKKRERERTPTHTQQRHTVSQSNKSTHTHKHTQSMDTWTKWLDSSSWPLIYYNSQFHSSETLEYQRVFMSFFI